MTKAVTPVAKKRQTSTPSTTRRRRSTVAATSTWPWPWPESEAVLGWSEFRRSGAAAIKYVCTVGDLSFSTLKSLPQARMRDAKEHEEEADAVPKHRRLSFQDALASYPELRALIMVGLTFLVMSGKRVVILDRHPDCPDKLVDVCMKHWRLEIRRKDTRQARRYAAKAAKGVDSIEALLRGELASKIAEVLVGSLETAGFGLTKEQKTVMARIGLGMAGDGLVASLRKPAEENLERVMLD